jgi:general secretion pathway protein G
MRKTVYQTPDARNFKGFTALEFVIVVCIASTLMVMFLNRVNYYQEQVEKATLLAMVVAIQDGLILKHGQLLTQGNETAIAALATVNPITFLEAIPSNYIGEFYDPSVDAIAHGKWAFDLKSRELIYLPEHPAHITFAVTTQPWLRYRVKLSGNFPATVEKKGLASATFEPVVTYHWEN